MRPARRRVLVLQLLRLGDILQTTPMLRAFRETEPETEITLVLQDKFHQTPVPAALYDRMVVFPFGSVKEALTARPERWPEETARLREFVASLGPEPFDLVANLSHSEASAYLNSVIPAHETRGIVAMPDRTRVQSGSWLTYFFASIAGRSKGCINLVDLHNWAAGVPCVARKPEIDVDGASRARMAGWLAEKGLGAKPLMAVQLGASEAKRMYPPDVMAAALNAIPTELADIVFLGVASERGLAERTLAQLRRPATSAVGETSVRELAALLERAALLLTVDTGTMHVAAAVGTRIVALFAAGPVFVHRTGPYGDGHLVIEPRLPCFPCEVTADCQHYACHHAIPPEEIAGLVRHALGDSPLPQPASARILKGMFTGSGRLEYRSVWPVAPDGAEIVRRASAVVWEQSLVAPGVKASQPSRRGHHASAGGRQRPSWSGAASIAEALTDVAGLARDAAAIADRIPSMPVDRQERSAHQLHQLMGRMLLAGEIEPVCQPFVLFCKVRLAALVDTDVTRVSRGYAREYRALERRARHLAQLLADTSWLADS